MGSEADDAIDLRVGEERSVRLSGLGVAGYRWVVDVEGDPAVAEVHSQGTEGDEGGEAAGASAEEVFSIHAKRPGEALIRFEQRRPWERGAPPTNQHTIQLRVT